MKVEVNKIQYDVRFERTWIKPNGRPFEFKDINEFNACSKKRMVTKCIISTIDESKHGRDRYVPVAAGVAYQSKKDAPVKFIGRKVSFCDAIERSSFDKDVRNAFYSHFESEHGFVPKKTEELGMTR